MERLTRKRKKGNPSVNLQDEPVEPRKATVANVNKPLSSVPRVATRSTATAKTAPPQQKKKSKKKLDFREAPVERSGSLVPATATAAAFTEDNRPFVMTVDPGDEPPASPNPEEEGQFSGDERDPRNLNDSIGSVQVISMTDQQRRARLSELDDEVSDRLRQMHDLMAESGMSKSLRVLDQQFNLEEVANKQPIKRQGHHHPALRCWYQ